MQEMEKYKRFCCVCCDPLDRKYALLTVSGQLTTVGQVIVRVSELSIGHLKECNAHVPHLLSICKHPQEDGR